MLKFSSGKPAKAAPQRPKRYRGAARGTLVGVRLQPNLLASLDRHRGGMTRPEAIRRLIEKALA